MALYKRNCISSVFIDTGPDGRDGRSSMQTDVIDNRSFRSINQLTYQPVQKKQVFDEFSGVSGDYGDNINPQTQEQVVQYIVDFGQGRVPYFLLGTVDTSIPKEDYDTGNY